MSKEKIIEDVFDELKRAENIHPGWPENIFEALAIVGEEFGELQQAVLQNKYEGGIESHIYEEAIQLSAMSLRFLFNLNGKTS